MTSDIPTLGLSQLRGKEITLGEKTYRLAPLTVADLGELEAWVATQLPDPIAVAKELVKDLPENLALEILREAYSDVKNGARRLGSSEAITAINTFAGYREMLFLHGRTHQPAMTRDDWGTVLVEMLAVDDKAADVRQVISEDAGGAVPDPKAGQVSSSVPKDGLLTGATSTTGSPSDGTGTGPPSIA